MRQSEESITGKSWTLTSGHKFSNSHTLLFCNSIYLFLAATSAVHSLVLEMCPNPWKERHDPEACRSKSPNLSTPDPFLWCFVTDKVRWTSLPSSLILVQLITTPFRTVWQQIPNSVWKSLKTRLHDVILELGAHVKQHRHSIKIFILQNKVRATEFLEH